jgi:UDP-N-acetylmuramate dehydrogenase
MAALDWEPATPAVVVGAGVPLGFLSRAAAIRGYTGLEFAEGIPGSLGGAVVMNAGAYGGQMGDLVEWAEAVEGDAAAGPRRLGPPELDFSYRHSALQESAAVVVRARLLLKHDRREDVEARCDEFAARRRERQPLEWPSAGSFFKRPPGRYAGPLIEGCGLKGLRVGGAQVSPKHANFIVNLGGATAADVLALAAEVRRRVADRFGVTLEPEVRILGQMAPPGQSLL